MILLFLYENVKYEEKLASSISLHKMPTYEIKVANLFISIKKKGKN